MIEFLNRTAIYLGQGSRLPDDPGAKVNQVRGSIHQDQRRAALVGRVRIRVPGSQQDQFRP